MGAWTRVVPDRMGCWEAFVSPTGLAACPRRAQIGRSSERTILAARVHTCLLVGATYGGLDTFCTGQDGAFGGLCVADWGRRALASCTNRTDPRAVHTACTSAHVAVGGSDFWGLGHFLYRGTGQDGSLEACEPHNWLAGHLWASSRDVWERGIIVTLASASQPVSKLGKRGVEPPKRRSPVRAMCAHVQPVWSAPGRLSYLGTIRAHREPSRRHKCARRRRAHHTHLGRVPVMKLDAVLA
jgi:hypothetical protein